MERIEISHMTNTVLAILDELRSGENERVRYWVEMARRTLIEGTAEALLDELSAKHGAAKARALLSAAHITPDPANPDCDHYPTGDCTCNVVTAVCYAALQHLAGGHRHLFTPNELDWLRVKEYPPAGPLPF